jgi:deoxyribose-phosphate aldolase
LRRRADSLWCSGNNLHSEPGDGTQVDRASPVQVTALGMGVVELAAGGRHTCARRLDRTLWCWGHNEHGQLGEGTVTELERWSPVPVVGFGAQLRRSRDCRESRPREAGTHVRDSSARTCDVAPTETMDFTYRAVASLLDHALLSPALTQSELRAGCLLARRYEVATAMVLPYFAPRAVELLDGSAVVASSTIGFPHGAQATELKAREARSLAEAGCRELDMVVNISRVKSADWAEVRTDIAAVLDPARALGAKLKVIFENCYLTESEKIRLCELCSELRVDWIKTSTGFGSSGSTWEDLELMLRHAGPGVQVKAAGGLRDLDAVLRARALGVTRVGTSSTQKILDECRQRLLAEGRYDGPDLPGEPAGSSGPAGY